MTVAELIEQLRNMPQNMRVMAADQEYGQYEIDQVKQTDCFADGHIIVELA